MKLNPRGRLFSVVTAATAGASATGQTENASPAAAASTSSAGPEVTSRAQRGQPRYQRERGHERPAHAEPPDREYRQHGTQRCWPPS